MIDQENFFQFETNDQDIGKRLDIFLTQQFLEKESSRAYMQKIISDGCVSINDKVVQKVGYKIRANDVISVLIPELSSYEKILPENLPLDILFEDDDLLVVNKARGMVVHPAVGSPNGTLVNALLFHCQNNLSGINGELRPGIVHRLDKDTSGLLLVAKNDFAHRHLAKQIQDKTAQRIYMAIVNGNFKETSGIIHGAIGRDVTNRQKMAVCALDKNAKDATTKFHVIENFKGYSLLECRLLTGRTHQIRVHMAYIHHSVVGDEKYGDKKVNALFQNQIHGQALHSQTIEFTHPRTNERLQFSVPMPDDMQQVLEMIKELSR